MISGFADEVKVALKMEKLFDIKWPLGLNVYDKTWDVFGIQDRKKMILETRVKSNFMIRNFLASEKLSNTYSYFPKTHKLYFELWCDYMRIRGRLPSWDLEKMAN